MRKIKFFTDHYYHIYNRGVEKRDIFLDERDYWRFLYCLYEANNSKNVSNAGHRFNLCISDNGLTLDLKDREPIVDILSLCLMPNHFHLLVTPKYDGAISDFMHRVGTSYTNYFNLKYGRSGVLFQGTFKAKFINSDAYLSHLVRYIHLNPLELFVPNFKEKGITNWQEANRILAGYKWSTHHNYLGGHHLKEVVNPTFILSNYFQNPEIYKKYLATWTPMSDSVTLDLMLD